VRSQFGAEFAQALFTLTPGGWHGPLRSGFGWHLVEVTALSPGHVPELADIRDELTRDWRSARAAEMREGQYRALRAQYRVEIRAPGGP
jgi:parvulin-like peptidyl-prolyl isomerase